MKEWKKKTVDGLFKQGLSGAGEMTPSPEVWRNIEHRLVEKRRKKRMLYFAVSSAASLLLFMSVLVFRTGNKENVKPLSSLVNKDSIAIPGSPEKKANNGTHLVLANTPAHQPVFSAPINRTGKLPGNTAEVPDTATPLQEKTSIPVPAQITQLSSGVTDSTSSVSITSEKETEPLLKQNVKKQEDLSPATLVLKDDAKPKPFSLLWFYSSDVAGAEKSDLQSSASIYSNEVKSASEKAYSGYLQKAYSLGLGLGYSFQKRLSMQTGIYFSHREGDAASVFLIQPAFVLSNAGADNHVKDTVNTSYQISLLEIPLIVKYNFIQKKRVKYFVSAGLSSGWISHFNLKNTSHYAEGSQYDNLSTPVQISMRSGIGLQYELMKQWGINIEPVLRYSLLSPAPFYQKPYISLTVGIIHNL